MSDWEKAGVIGVDAGVVWIGDPCYCVTPDATEHPAKTWAEFCDKLRVDEYPVCKQFNYSAGHAGLGVCVSTRFGDGQYPVYVKRDADGRITAAMVDFGDED